MATALYGKNRAALANKQIDWINDTIQALLVRTDAGHYAVDIDVHEFLSDIAAGDRVQNATIPLAGKSNVLGVLDATDPIFAAVPLQVAPYSIGAIVLVQDTGAPATSRLLAYIDNFAGMPFLPSGADVLAGFSNGANKICKI